MSATEQVHYIEPRRPINEIIADLSKPISQSYLKERKQGGATLTYIPWHFATKLLDYFAPGWSYHLELKEMAGKVVAIASITIMAAEGEITRMASGYEDEETNSFGDPFSNSSSMALRRAAAHFGLGRSLYK